MAAAARAAAQAAGYVGAGTVEFIADQDGTARSDQPVRNPAAAQTHQVHHRRIESVDRAGFGIREPETAFGHAGSEIKDQDRAHAVVAEALPHLGEEQGGQAARVAEKALVRSNGIQGGGVV